MKIYTSGYKLPITHDGREVILLGTEDGEVKEWLLEVSDWEDWSICEETGRVILEAELGECERCGDIQLERDIETVCTDRGKRWGRPEDCYPPEYADYCYRCLEATRY